MTSLHELVGEQVDKWRSDAYPCEAHPAITEILEWGREPETGHGRYLREPQIRALETYWWLRLMAGTQLVPDLYRSLSTSNTELLAGLGLDFPDANAIALDRGIDSLLELVRSDDTFVAANNLEALRETLTLNYPSYIFALAMGAGKTVLIGSVIATEFAMSMEYPDDVFIANALVFAPGKTIIQALRQLYRIPYDRIIPPRMQGPLAASLKITFTRDGERDIPVTRQSTYNLVVTNTEKIRIQKEAITKSDIGRLLPLANVEEAKEEVANLRLQTLAQLPHLGVFSDEAHHTYGQSLGSDLKKVRKTVDYLAENTDVICTVNTTGTPYFGKQILRDVVVWYSLAQGIADGILKDVADNIVTYDFHGDVVPYIEKVVSDFFHDYGDVALPNGAKAKLAIYFPQTGDINQLRPAIDRAVIEAGLDPTVCLVNTSNATLTSASDIEAFNRLNDPRSPHRVMLLVNKGTEGWDCPSLFATALARKLKTSNNFVLQAASRCLRQIPGNTTKARIYLSPDNYGTLDKQLQETFRQTVDELTRARREQGSARIVLRKTVIPPVTITKTIQRVERAAVEPRSLTLTRPTPSKTKATKRTYATALQQATRSVLVQTGTSQDFEVEAEDCDAFQATVELAGRYRVSVSSLLPAIRSAYGEHDVPIEDLDVLGAQIESQTRSYTIRKEQVDVALALVRVGGFDSEQQADGSHLYTADIVFPKDREHLLARWEDAVNDNPADFGFHYSPYNFDSNPEKSLYELLLRQANIEPQDVEDVYFTGALTDPAKTDFFVEYRTAEGRWRRYSPDFLVVTKTGRIVIVEVKAENKRHDVLEGQDGRKALAVREWVNLDPDRIKYVMAFTATAVVTVDEATKIAALWKA